MDDISLIKNAAKIAKYPVLGFTKSVNPDSKTETFNGLLIRTGDDSASRWNPISSEADLYHWLADVGLNPFHHGFVIFQGCGVEIPEGYVPKLVPYDDKQDHSRKIVSSLVSVLSSNIPMIWAD